MSETEIQAPPEVEVKIDGTEQYARLLSGREDKAPPVVSAETRAFLIAGIVKSKRYVKAVQFSDDQLNREAFPYNMVRQAMAQMQSQVIRQGAWSGLDWTDKFILVKEDVLWDLVGAGLVKMDQFQPYYGEANEDRSGFMRSRPKLGLILDYPAVN